MNAALSTLTESGDPPRTRRRLIVLLLLAMLGLVSLMLVLGHHMRRHTIAEEFARRNGDIARAYAQDLQLSLELYRARAHALLAKPGVLAAVRAGDRAALLRLVAPEFDALRAETAHFSVLHFHGPDNVTLLRAHRPERYGDDLGAIRPMIAEANRSRRPLSGFEIGKNGISHRIGVPIFDGEIFLGTLELGIDVGHFSERMARVFGVETALVFLRSAMAAYLAEHGEDGLLKLGDQLAPRTTPMSVTAV